MIVSHKFKLIFIKTRKTAGTSIEIFLSQVCGNQDIVTPIGTPSEVHEARNYTGYWNPLPDIIESRGKDLIQILKYLWIGEKYYNHMTGLMIRRRLSNQVWTDYFKFCVERNPWDKTLSHYHFINHRSGGNLLFDEYLALGNLPINYPLYTDNHDQIMVDKVIKYEVLNKGLKEVFANLGIPFSGQLDQRAKSQFRQDRRPYQEVYTPQQRKAIEQAFSKEIELHGYSF